MAIEVSDVVQPLEQPGALAPAQEELPAEQEQTAPLVAAPRGRGRPAGSKDRQPRKRPAPAASADVLGEEEQEEEEDEPPPPRPVTRRSRVRAPKSAPRRRVQFVEEEAIDSPAEEAEPPPSPRTRRHQEWTTYRQQKADAHRAKANRYAALFDRMLA